MVLSLKNLFNLYQSDLIIFWFISEDIDEFIEEDVYRYGDFSWVDFESVKGLEAIEPQKVAELFYVSKMWKVIDRTYFDKLKNRFIYTAHDDGWSNHIFYNDISDYKEILSKIIVDKIYRLYNLQLDIIDSKTVNSLYKRSMKGLSIDLLRLSIEEDDTITIPIYQLGKFKDMDKVYELSRESEVEVKLELKYNTEWKLIELNR